MKSALLLLLVVAELLPNLSEGRIVSKCELKEKLEEKIYLPGRVRKHKEEILSIIICEVSLKSNMSTSLVNVDGIRLSLSTVQRPTEGIAAPTAPATTTTTTTTAAAAPVSSNSNAAAGGSRKKQSHKERYAHYSLSDMENLFDEEEMQSNDEQMSSSEKDRTNPKKIHLWSVGYYGIFQLSDSHFCDSGYRWSKNVCGKLCSDFTDDDITDDIDCLVNSNYDWYLFRSISKQCFTQRKTFLQDCA